MPIFAPQKSIFISIFEMLIHIFKCTSVTTEWTFFSFMLEKACSWLYVSPHMLLDFGLIYEARLLGKSKKKKLMLPG
jgi:hypothetical protein